MENKVMAKTFLWMFVGLLITFVTGIFVSTNERILTSVFSTGLFYAIIIAELVIVIILSARALKMSKTAARIWFMLYAFVSGLTFSSVFVLYKVTSVIYIFLIAAALFGVFGLIGYKTNKDLTKIGTFLLMALFAIILCTVINIFLNNTVFEIVLSIICILVFLGITAYDMQKIKMLENSGINEDSLAIIGALELYLDFINIFLHLLSLFGNSKD